MGSGQSVLAYEHNSQSSMQYTCTCHKLGADAWIYTIKRISFDHSLACTTARRLTAPLSVDSCLFYCRCLAQRKGVEKGLNQKTQQPKKLQGTLQTINLQPQTLKERASKTHYTTPYSFPYLHPCTAWKRLPIKKPHEMSLVTGSHGRFFQNPSPRVGPENSKP